ncbi:hypothetical protein IX39_09185 [Chryseobacterium formosense]|uniref:Uncharacterized protein n=1 Tax=Chryseobacterium formosense TaxID=236814 RepID=A0A085Z8L1_9FLAO|nr:MULTISPECIES: hypothetical protein [Chryseobacterium]KFF00775.1 hypothetical protein IX39_09185 [Chryseobacterium formosense]OCK51145.1 hypothetical protein BA768_18005 [Chryseobacterium sp. CBo1]SFT37763.1 hypothetical protein SAMN05421857_0530 [Chryseobacterium formosense]
MKALFIIFSIILFNFSQAQNKQLQEKIRTKQLKVQNQENALDLKRVTEELKEEKKEMGPFTYGIFAYPDYDSISKNSFAGLGTLTNIKGADLKGKNIAYAGFSEGKSNLNTYRVSENDRIFFTILVLTDFVGDKENPKMRTQVVSRNFPDAICQGFVKTSNNKIDFSAFSTLENDEFAIVNMKLYNLKYGNVILIAPQKDGSLRSIQIKSEKNLTSTTLKNFVDELLNRENIIEFFTNKNTI